MTSTAAMRQKATGAGDGPAADHAADCAARPDSLPFALWPPRRRDPQRRRPRPTSPAATCRASTSTRERLARRQHRRRRRAVRLRADRRRPLQPHLRRHRRRRARATCCAGRRSATCCRAPTTWAASTASSPPCADTPVPVAPALGFTDDRRVNGAPFYVMGFVDGVVIRDRADRRDGARRPSARPGAGQLDRRHDGRHPRRRPRRRRPRRPRPPRGLHRPPAEAVVRPVERSRRRASCPTVDDGPRRPAGRASPSRARRPSSTATTASTTAWSAPRAPCVAVLDWEICTLGDPLADVGLLQVYWTGPDDERSAWPGPATDGRRASPTAPRCSTATPRCRAAT